jgi:hypothetical protein
LNPIDWGEQLSFPFKREITRCRNLVEQCTFSCERFLLRLCPDLPGIERF